MTISPGGTPTPHTYRLRWRSALQSCSISIVFFLLVVPALIGFLVLGTRILSLAALRSAEAEMVTAVALAGVAVLFMLPPLFVATILVAQLVFSYLKISSDGLEFRLWPAYGLCACWEDVERIGKYRVWGIIPHDVLYLRRAEPVGPRMAQSLRRAFRINEQIVLLTDFRGWPNGKLADDLRAHLHSRAVEGSVGSGQK